jgi:hypothetical protein
MPCNPSGGIAWARNGTILFRRDEDGDERNDIYRMDRPAETTPVVETDGRAFLVDTADDRGLLYTSDERKQLS